MERHGRVEWRVDGVPVGSADADAPLAWPLVTGRHVVSVHDSHGRRADAAIVVK